MAETLMKPKGLGISSPHCGSYLALIYFDYFHNLSKTLLSNIDKAHQNSTRPMRFGPSKV